MASETTKSKQATTLDLSSVLNLIWDHFWLILFTAALGGGAVFFYRVSTPPVYSSRAVLEVVNDRAPIEFQATQNTNNLNDAALLKTIEQTIASQAVLRRVIETNRLAEDPTFAPPRPELAYSEGELIELLRQRISVNLVRGTRLIAVTAHDGDPRRAKQLAQSVIEAFFGQNLDTRREGSSSTREVLFAEAKRLEEELRKSEERLQGYLEEHNAVSLTDRQSVVGERLRHLQQQVTAAKNTRLTLETDQALIETVTLDNPEKLLTLRQISSQPEIVDLRKQLNAHAAEVATLAQRYRDKHPSMLRAKQQLEETREALHEMVRHAAQSILQTYASAKATEAALERELARQEKAALELERVAIPFRVLEREVQSNAELYQQVLARLKATDVTQGIMAGGGGQASGLIRVVEQPMIPLQPAQMPLFLVVGAGVAAGALAGCGLALAGHALDSSVQSVDDAEGMLGVPSLAVVPRSSHRNLNKGPVVATHPKTPEAEAFRSLRTSLTLLRTDEERRAVLFTSAVPGEGKSYCSTNYATAVAQQGFRTLLIDGDLRRPRLRRVFARSSRQPGLSDCLHDPRLFPQAVHATTVGNLFIIGDPRGTQRGLELMGRDNLQLVLSLAFGGFDRVVIDTAPLTAVSDALYFAQHVSTVCLVIHAGRTPRRTVRRACKLLAEVAKKTPAGVVLNQIRGGRASRYYYYSDSESYIRNVAPAAIPG